MLSNYADLLRIRGAWKFSLAGMVLRAPMSLMGISTILLVKGMYGNYTLAGAVSAISVVPLSICAPILARLVDQRGQAVIMVPSLVVSALATIGLFGAAVLHAPSWVLFIFAGLSGATWGSPGALVRARWAKVVRTPKQLTTAYAFEAAVDEVVFVIGPIVATLLGTALHPGTGLILSVFFIIVGSIGFFPQRASEPTPTPKIKGVRQPTVLLNPVIIILVLTFIGAGVMFGANDVAVVAFTEEHAHPELAGVLLGFFAMGSFTAALFYGARHWTTALWKLFAIGILALAIGVSTFLLAHSLLALGVAMLVTGLAIAPTMTNVNAIVSKVVASSQLTEGLTWMSTAMNIGVSVGATLGGRVIDASGAHGGILVTVSFGWVMVAVMLIGLPRLRRDVLRAEAEPLIADSSKDEGADSDTASSSPEEPASQEPASNGQTPDDHTSNDSHSEGDPH